MLSLYFTLADKDMTRLLTFCPPELQNHPFAARPPFVDWRLAAIPARNAALDDTTRAKRDSSWRCYERFLGQVGVELDPFLRQIGQAERTKTFAFAAALRDGEFRGRQLTTAGN
jgi:hypothetical protein